MHSLRLWIVGLLVAVSLSAQASFRKPLILGQAVASQFNWKLEASVVATAGATGTITLMPSFWMLPDSIQITPWQIGLPVTVLDGNITENVTLSSFSCAPGSSPSCQASAFFAFSHSGRMYVQSATDGLQEAINYLHAHEGGTVIVDHSWLGSASQIINALGASNVLIHDIRSGHQDWYAWNGTSYVPELSLNDGASPSIVFNNVTPVFNQGLISASHNRIVNAAGYGVVNSDFSTSGSMAAGSSTLSLAASGDFANGQSIVVVGAGLNNVLTAPLTPSVTVMNSNNSQTCQYAVAALDSNLGETAASAPTNPVNCGGVGNSTNNVITTFNTLSWNPVTSAQGYVIYEKIGSANWAVAGVTMIPASVVWWTASTAYAQNTSIQPRGPQYNGWDYVATTAGVSGINQPAWCETAGCAVSDGSVVWTAQPVVFHDDGRNWAWFNVRPNSHWIPSSPPVAAINDALITDITSGGGSTNLSLATVASNTETGLYVGHDNTAALQAALDAVNSGCQSRQPFSGSAFYGSCPALHIPAGIYEISSSLNNNSLYDSIQGGNDTVIRDINPVSNIIDYWNMYQNNISSITFYGGRNQIMGVNCGTDNTLMDLSNLQLENSNDYALSFFNDCLSSDDHLSSSLIVRNSKLIGNEGELYNYGDRVAWRSNWSEPEPALNSLMWGRAEIVLPETGGEFHSTDSEYIPDFGTPSGIPGGTPANMRWVDDFWDFLSNSDRFSGEGGGGIPCVYYYGGFPAPAANAGIVEGGMISFSNDWLFCGGAQAGVGTNSGSGKVFLAAGMPQDLLYRNNYGYSEPLVSVAANNNIDLGLLPVMQSAMNANPQYSSLGAINIQVSPDQGMAGCNTAWDSLVLQYPSSGMLFPASLLPYITDPECRQTASVPSDGYWGVNEEDFERPLAGMIGNRGWVNLRQGLAAPSWQPDTSYAAGQFAIASPDNGHVFEVTTPGISASAQPAWNTASGGNTTDGSVIWTEAGQSALFAPLGPVLDSKGDATVAGNLSVQGSGASTISGSLSVGGNISGSIMASSLLQSAPSSIGGACSMSNSSSCVVHIASSYAAPVCIASEQGASTPISAACSVSGTVVTITASQSNSGTWGCLVFGNPD